MDPSNFRYRTEPNYYPAVNSQKVANIGLTREVPPIVTAPVEDPRFSGYGGIMSDGRLITDYRSHCEYNYSPSKYGESVRIWLQHNSDAIMQVTRQRQASRMGAQYRKADTVPPTMERQKCNEFECNFSYNLSRDAIGMSRHEGVPELFGTFSDGRLPMPYPSKAVVTSDYEGGRNTPRGQRFQPLGGSSLASQGISG